jgi:hypothetical protein
MLGAITAGTLLDTRAIAGSRAAAPQPASLEAATAFNGDPLAGFLEFFLSVVPQESAEDPSASGEAVREVEDSVQAAQTTRPQFTKWAVTLPAAKKEDEDAAPRREVATRATSPIEMARTAGSPAFLPPNGATVAGRADRQSVEVPREQVANARSSRQSNLALLPEARPVPAGATTSETARVAFVATVSETSRPEAGIEVHPSVPVGPIKPSTKIASAAETLPADPPKNAPAEQHQPSRPAEAVQLPDTKETENRQAEQSERPAAAPKPETKPAQPEHVPPTVVATAPPERPTSRDRQTAEEVRPQPAQATSPEPKAGQTPAVRQMVLQLPAGPSKSVAVHLAESAGRVRVTVRTNDPEVTAALRSQLTELVRSVTSKGMQIETWTPPDSYPLAALPHSATAPDLAEQSPQGDGQRQQQPQDPGSGDQRQRRGSQPDWLAELEDTLAKE